MVKVFEIEARFPRHVDEYPPAAPTWVGRWMSTRVSWSTTGGRAARPSTSVAQIRRVLGSRAVSADDEAKLAGWRADNVAPVETFDETGQRPIRQQPGGLACLLAPRLGGRSRPGLASTGWTGHRPRGWPT